MILGKNRGININYKYITLLTILLIGLFLRVYDLSGESIWLDEAYSIKFANLNLSEIIFYPENNPPLYYIILHWWINLFGNSEFAIRFPSVIFGFLSIIMIYKIGSRIFDQDVGILSSLLLGLSVFHIHYSRETRTYSLTALLTLLSIYFFIKLFDKRNFTVLFGFILSSTLLIYSHIYGIFIIISQNIYIIALFLLSKETYRLDFKRWTIIQIILIVLFTPWVNIFVTQTLKVVQGDFWIPPPSLSSILKSFITYSGSKLLFLIYVILASLSILTYEKMGGNIKWKNIFQSIESYRWKIRLLNADKIFFLLVWLLTPIILPFVISLFLTPIYNIKYTIVASLSFYLLVAKGLNNISQKYFKLVLISVIIVLSLLNIREYYTKINNEQWRDLAYYIDTDAQNGDLLLFNTPGCQIAFNYYSKRADLIKKPFPEEGRQVNEENIIELGPTVKGYRRIWVILSHSRDEKELITKKLIEAYNLSYQKKYAGIKLFFFERRGRE